ncbi:MAG: sigma-54 interaction domain-containing protein, partial [Candidatus Zixiibacteriota bacterium]
SRAMKEVRRMISLVGPKDTTVLITGASGTGKELVARGLHALSPRREKRQVSINCAAFPENLLESELFGYEKGAFTGADKVKQGRFELADGGTLFLDEIGEMPLTMQAKLLRVLEDHTIERLGSVKQIPLDIRLIAATNRKLKEMVKEGKIREDLFFRLNVVEISLPPLKERGGDILILAKKFLDKYSKKIGKEIHGIDSSAAQLLSNYDWPGNVRELENVIERGIILTESNQITKNDLMGLDDTNKRGTSDQVRLLSEMESRFIRRCLESNDWNIGKSAEELGIHRNTLSSKIKEYGLSKDSQ